MPCGAEQADDVKSEIPGVSELHLHLSEGGSGVLVQVNTSKAQVPDVPCDVGEDNGARQALQRVHPVAGPGITHQIGFAAIPDVEAVDSVKKNRKPDKGRFNCS